MNGPRSPLPPTTLAGRLTSARRKRFVGRQAELELFRTFLAPDAPYPILYIYGPGGVGKSTFVRECIAHAETEGITTFLMDGRDIDPSPIAFLGALHLVAAIPEGENPFTALAAYPQLLLVIDTYEALAPLGLWLREQFLPNLPGNCRVVMAGRFAPTPGWREGGWADLMGVISLRNLPPSESVAFLNARHVPESQQAAVVAITHGHPLALSLVGDIVAQTPDGAPFELSHAPDVVGLLLDRFVQEVPTPRHREALEITAHVRVTSEALLAETLGAAEAPALFAWLRSLSFMDYHPQGIFPHDLARDVLDTDLRWRNAERYVGMHQQVRRYIVQRFLQSSGMAQQRAFFDLLYLHRNSPVMRPYYDWGGMGDAFSEPSRPEDIPAILEMIRHHEGEESARIAAYWIEQQPQNLTAFRRSDDPLFGFAFALILTEITPEQRSTDPAMEKAWQFLQSHAPLRTGDVMVYIRFWAGKEEYQLNTAAHNLMGMLCARLWLTTTKLAWSFLCPADPVHYSGLYSYMRFRRIAEADFQVGGHTYGVFSHDWRTESMLAWLDGMAAQELATEVQPDVQPSAPAVLVLSQTEFKESVRHALRDFHNLAALAQNPLLRSHLCLELDPTPRPATLQRLLRSAAAPLQNSPKEEKRYRVLHYTYFEPLATQELVAERLDLPFSTYRYHLSNGIERVTDWLWQKEIYH